MNNCSHIIIILTERYFQEKVTTNKSKIWRDWSISSHLSTPYTLEYFLFSSSKEHCPNFLSRELSGVQEELPFMSTGWEKINASEETEFCSLSFRPVCIIYSCKELLSCFFIDMRSQAYIHQVGQLLCWIFLPKERKFKFSTQCTDSSDQYSRRAGRYLMPLDGSEHCKPGWAVNIIAGT